MIVGCTGTLAPELSDGRQPARDLALLVHDLSLLPSACKAVIPMHTNVRQMCVISARAVGPPRIVKYMYIYLDSINIGRGHYFISYVAVLIG